MIRLAKIRDIIDIYLYASNRQKMVDQNYFWPPNCIKNFDYRNEIILENIWIFEVDCKILAVFFIHKVGNDIWIKKLAKLPNTSPKVIDEILDFSYLENCHHSVLLDTTKLLVMTPTR